MKAFDFLSPQKGLGGLQGPRPLIWSFPLHLQLEPSIHGSCHRHTVPVLAEPGDLAGQGSGGEVGVASSGLGDPFHVIIVNVTPGTAKHMKGARGTLAE